MPLIINNLIKTSGIVFVTRGSLNRRSTGSKKLPYRLYLRQERKAEGSASAQLVDFANFSACICISSRPKTEVLLWFYNTGDKAVHLLNLFIASINWKGLRFTSSVSLHLCFSIWAPVTLAVFVLPLAFVPGFSILVIQPYLVTTLL